ncbi:hypothetical protein ACOMHN_065560 [Nucella lapillus]
MRVTCLERQGLTQHLQMPVPAAPSMPIPLARQQPATLDEGQKDIRHQFQLPQNTAGTGEARRKRAAVKIQAAVPIAPSPSTSIPLLCLPSAQPYSAPTLFTLPQQILSTMERPAEQKPPPQPSTAGTSSMLVPSTPQPQSVSRKVSRTTAWRQRKRQQLEEELGVSMPRSRRTLSFCFRFNMRVTCLERQGLTQHLKMPVPAAPSMPIPLARQQPATLDEGQEDIRHQFQLPQNTALPLPEIPRHMANVTGCGGVGLFLHCPSLSGRTNRSSLEIYKRK